MSFTFKEIDKVEQLKDVVELQKKIFGLTDIEVIPEGVLLLLIRKEYPMGFILGCFKEDSEEIVGIAINMNGIDEFSNYCPLIGVLPEYSRTGIGIRLIKELISNAIRKGRKKFAGVYNPLNANIAKVYNYYGLHATKFLDESAVDEIVPGKAFFNLEIRGFDEFEQIIGKRKYKPKQAIEQLPIITDTQCNLNEFLLEIPNNYANIVENNNKLAQQWVSNTHFIFNEYLNNRAYKITDCFSIVFDKQKHTYLMFSK